MQFGGQKCYRHVSGLILVDIAGSKTFGQDLKSWKTNTPHCVAIRATIYRECSGARAGKCPRFGLFGAKKRQKTLKKHSLGHSEPGAQNTEKAGTFRPGPLSTPVNGGPDRNHCGCPDSRQESADVHDLEGWGGAIKTALGLPFKKSIPSFN